MKTRKKNRPVSGGPKGVVGENVVVPNPVGNLSSTSKPKETKFGLQINYGGTNIPGNKWEFEKYVGGHEMDNYGFDADRFGYFDLVDEVKKLGYVEWGRLTYRVPCTPLQKDIKNDSCVMEMLKHIVDGYRILEVYVVDGRNVADVISGLASIDDLLEDEIVAEKENELMPNEVVGEEENEIEVKVRFDEVEDDVEGEDESGKDDNYVPDYPEEETNDEMEACELVPDDEEYIQVRKKKKDDKVVEITDEMFLSINNVDKGNNWGDFDYELSDDEGLSDTSHLEGTKVKERHRIITYDPKCDHKLLRLTVGMSFTDGYEANDAITDNAVENGCEIHFKEG